MLWNVLNMIQVVRFLKGALFCVCAKTNLHWFIHVSLWLFLPQKTSCVNSISILTVMALLNFYELDFALRHLHFFPSTAFTYNTHSFSASLHATAFIFQTFFKSPNLTPIFSLHHLDYIYSTLYEKNVVCKRAFCFLSCLVYVTILLDSFTTLKFLILVHKSWLPTKVTKVATVKCWGYLILALSTQCSVLHSSMF